MKELKILIIIIVFTTLSTNSFADRVLYRDSLNIKVECDNYIVIHKHNWWKRWEQIEHNKLLTTEDSLLSGSITCINKITGDTIFRKPCSALTFITISADENYIIGISNIKNFNPFQLYIYDRKGLLIKKRHISSQEAKLSKTQLEKFEKKFDIVYRELCIKNKIYNVDSLYFIDINDIDNDAAWDFLYKNLSYNHLSKHFSESITNYIEWYAEDNPRIELMVDDKGLKEISILDPKKERIIISIKE